MAVNIREKTPSSTSMMVYDVAPAAAKKLASEHQGVQAADSVGQVASESDLIITMLPENEHVKQVYAQIFESGASGKSNVLMS